MSSQRSVHTRSGARESREPRHNNQGANNRPHKTRIGSTQEQTAQVRTDSSHIKSKRDLLDSGRDSVPPSTQANKSVVLTMEEDGKVLDDHGDGVNDTMGRTLNNQDNESVTFDDDASSAQDEVSSIHDSLSELDYQVPRSVNDTFYGQPQNIAKSLEDMTRALQSLSVSYKGLEKKMTIFVMTW